MVHTMKRVQDDRSIARKGARRRSYETAFKRHLVELSLVPGASVAKIALDHRLNAFGYAYLARLVPDLAGEHTQDVT